MESLDGACLIKQGLCRALQGFAGLCRAPRLTGLHGFLYCNYQNGNHARPAAFIYTYTAEIPSSDIFFTPASI
jgi:hypothetical protein